MRLLAIVLICGAVVWGVHELLVHALDTVLARERRQYDSYQPR